MRRLILLAAVMSTMAPGGLIAAETYTVTMADMTYAPANLSPRVGDTIRFVNDDAANHVVFVPTAGHAVDLGVQKPGEERKITLMKAGSFEVECANHDHMLLTVEVLP